MVTRRDRANALRALSMDAVQQANSGHPGMPMGMADIAEVLWNDFLKHNPDNPNWYNRDRFILSNGHGSMLQYSLLHLTGYDLNLNELKNFRQLHSKTPGHPEYGPTPGVEVTTGPLGQGLSNAVGIAMAETRLAKEFNQPGFNLIDHHTYVFLGDGCMMEGISHEVCSLAGHLKLGKLVAFWDDNRISIDGDVSGWFTDDTPARFESYGWHVVTNVDGHDSEAIRGAILKALSVIDKPTLICCRTMIAFGAPNAAGTKESHGAPLGEEEIAAAKRQLGWTHPSFEIPEALYAAWDAREKGSLLEKEWETLFTSYKKEYPELASEFTRRMKCELPKDWEATSQTFIEQSQKSLKEMATRKASLEALNTYGPLLPELMGGSADLTGSNCTWWKGSTLYTDEHRDGNYIHYGVREFGMAGIMNGIARHGGIIPYAGTFLTFADYARNAIRLAAMMKQHVIYVLTHDSIGLGEDGPTHQPIEHLNMLRMTPNLIVWRPADLVETAVAWQQAILHNNYPSVLALSRQNVPALSRNQGMLKEIKRGGYILSDCEGSPDSIIIATGSEVSLAIDAAEQLTQQGKKIRVVSMPSTDLFALQDDAYQEKVLPKAVTARVAIEAGQPDFWYRYVGLHGRVIGINQFGESAPYQDVYEALGITTTAIIKAVNEII